tara:strand:- start:236 stop:487 length:252 start_codon:yes stop_codon:yes gene_type:complete
MNENILSIFAIAIYSTGLNAEVVGEQVNVYLDDRSGRALLDCFNESHIKNGQALKFLQDARKDQEKIKAIKEASLSPYLQDIR